MAATPQQLQVIIIDEDNHPRRFEQQISAALAEIERRGGALIPPIQLATTPFGTDGINYTALLLYRTASQDAEEVR